MYAVIFRAEINELDETYYEMATRLRDLAQMKYGCVEFTAISEGNTEVAISYWEDTQQILAWKNDPEHLTAQKMGQTKWYKQYRVEIVKIERSYSHSTRVEFI